MKNLGDVTVVDNVEEFGIAPYDAHLVFVVASKGGKITRSMSLMYAVNLGASLVNEDWADACCKAQSNVAIDVENHAPVFAEAQLQDWGTTCAAVLGRGRKLTKIFKDVYVYCDPRCLQNNGGKGRKLPRTAFQEMIEAGGGNFLYEPPIGEREQQQCLVISTQDVFTNEDKRVSNRLVTDTKAYGNGGFVYSANILFDAVMKRELYFNARYILHV